MELKLKDKIAFISGSTSGIGFATAKMLLAEGMQVYINGRSSTGVTKAVDELKAQVKGAKVFGIVADFKKPQEVQELTNQIPEVDVLINNVGIYNSQSFFDTSDEQWNDQFQVNFMSGVHLSQHYLQKMLNKNWGRIIFISSECAYLVPTDMISYSATKAAIHALSRGLAQIAKGTAVTVNVIVPGSTMSEGAKDFLANKAKLDGVSQKEVETSFFSSERTQSLLERFASVEEVSNAIIYLCSPLSSATNGSVLKVDGGSSGGIL
jgi:NAD(P)-dependent dehydrogenase (short-subunit alcohol dehydrogenase family)